MSNIQEMKDIIQNFADKFFQEERELIEFSNNFFEKNGFEIQTEVDYIKINRFVQSSYNTIKMAYAKNLPNLVEKFYQDLLNLNNFYRKFIKKVENTENIYKVHFLKRDPGAVSYYKLLSESKDRFKDEIVFKENFYEIFSLEKEYYDKTIRTIINTKTYYFDKLLWFEAKKSKNVVDYFKNFIGDGFDPDKDMSTKFFIKKYLRSIDPNNSKNSGWYKYLSKITQKMV